MLSIVPPLTFSAPARIVTPGGASFELGVTWRHLGSRAFAAWAARADKASSDAAFINEVIQAWTGVGDEQGNPLPYSLEALERLLDAYPSAGVQLFAAYRSALVDARAKN